MRIAILGPPTGLSGGPSSFRAALERSLTSSGHTLVDAEHERDSEIPDAVLVIGGSRHLASLFRLKRRGAIIVLRLDGVPTASWRRLGYRSRTRQLTRLIVILFIRAFVATRIIYQSEFSRQAWNDVPLGRVRQPASEIVCNGTELDVFTPADVTIDQVAVVEGSISEVEEGVELIAGISQRFVHLGRRETFLVCGRVSQGDHEKLAQLSNVVVAGALGRPDLAREVGRSRAMLSLEVAPACPNSVIESLAAGTPVVGFVTGAMPELVDPKCGALTRPREESRRASEEHVRALADNLVEILDHHEERSRAARTWSQEHFDIHHVAEQYARVMSR